MKKNRLIYFFLIIVISAIIIICIAFKPFKNNENEDILSGGGIGIDKIITDKNYMSCKEIGMIPDDETKGNINFNLLKNYLISGKFIISVDASYYLSNNSKELIIEIDNLLLFGINKNAEFKFNGITYLFKYKNNAAIDKIQIENIIFTSEYDGHNNQAPRIFCSDTTDIWFINEFILSDCTFNGGFSVLRLYAPTDTDPAEKAFGFNKISIIDNTFKDIGWGQPIFIFNDYMHDILTVEGNKVYNLDDTFIYSGITNDSVYSDNIALGKRIYISEIIYLLMMIIFWLKKTVKTVFILQLSSMKDINPNIQIIILKASRQHYQMYLFMMHICHHFMWSAAIIYLKTI